MKLVTLPASAIRLRYPLPFSVYDPTGRLLLAKGTVVRSEDEREFLIKRGGHMDVTDSDQYQRAMAGKLDGMMRQNVSLKQLSTATASPEFGVTAVVQDHQIDRVAVWAELQSRASTLLKESNKQDWPSRMDKLQIDVHEQIVSDADAALLILIQATCNEVRSYSATHALLVTVVCELAAQHIAAWPASFLQPLRCAALTMNLAMTQLQDRLAQHSEKLNSEQRAHVQGHPARSVEMLKAAGVDDALWLSTVAAHHGSQPGPLADKSVDHQLGRLVERCDIYAARLSARGKRKALSATAAAQAIYTDERKQPDEAGGAVLKGVGLYPPGSFVRLGNSEIGLVLARGRRANEPVVASIVGREGLALAEPIVRDTKLPLYSTSGGVAPHEIKVLINLERMLKMRPNKG